jgi:hypothetical protein
MDARTISVTGTGRAVVRPDLADLRLGVTITSPTVEAARAAAATAMTAIVARLKAAGVRDADIQTAILALSPAYDYSANTTPPRLTGYTLANTVAVTIRDIDQIGEIVDGAFAAGATSLDRIAFRVEDQSAAETAARQAAVRDARAKAETLASAAGVSITGLATIVESVGPIPFTMPHGEVAMLARDASTPVEAGTNDVSVTVAATYLID